MIKTMGMIIVLVLVFIALAGQIYTTSEDEKKSRNDILNNISQAISNHQMTVLKALPQTNYTAQAEAIATIEDLKQEVSDIKNILTNSSQ